MASSSELRRATEQLKQMRQVLNTATTIPEHEQRLTALDGPRLDAVDRSLPLPLLRSRIAALLDQAASRLERARSAAPPTSPRTLLGEIARTGLACLALAVGYAGRPGDPAGNVRCWRSCRSAGTTSATMGGADGASAHLGAPALALCTRTICGESVRRRMMRTLHGGEPAPGQGSRRP